LSYYNLSSKDWRSEIKPAIFIVIIAPFSIQPFQTLLSKCCSMWGLNPLQLFES